MLPLQPVQLPMNIKQPLPIEGLGLHFRSPLLEQEVAVITNLLFRSAVRQPRTRRLTEEFFSKVFLLIYGAPRRPQTAEHLDKLIATLDEPYSTMVWLHAVAIPRPSEGFAFKWSDLNTETNQLMVVRAVNRGKFHTPKYHRVNRPVQLTPADVQRLLALKKLQDAADSDWIFPSENPEAPLRHEDVLSRKIQPKTRELGLPHVTWRLLRKWGSTHLIANRLPVNAVQDRLGHSRPDIVLIHYARFLDESAVAAAASVSSKLSARSAELENAGFKLLDSQLAASLSPVAVSD